MKSEVHEEVLGRLHIALDCVGGETQPGPQIEVKAHKKSQSSFLLPAVDKLIKRLRVK